MDFQKLAEFRKNDSYGCFNTALYKSNETYPP